MSDRVEVGAEMDSRRPTRALTDPWSRIASRFRSRPTPQYGSVPSGSEPELSSRRWSWPARGYRPSQPHPRPPGPPVLPVSPAPSDQASQPNHAAVGVPSPSYRSTPSLGHTLAGSPTGNLRALHVAGLTLAWYLCRPVGLGESGHRDTTRCPTGQARRRQDRPGSIGVIGPAHSAPARIPRPGPRTGGRFATDRDGAGRPVVDPVHLHESGKVGRRPVGVPVGVPVCVPFRSRHHLSWYPAHVALTLRPFPLHQARPRCGCGRPDQMLAWPCGQVSDRARGGRTWTSLAGRKLTGRRPIPGMRAHPDRRTSRRCPGGIPARVCPGDWARRKASDGTAAGWGLRTGRPRDGLPGRLTTPMVAQEWFPGMLTGSSSRTDKSSRPPADLRPGPPSRLGRSRHPIASPPSEILASTKLPARTRALPRPSSPWRNFGGGPLAGHRGAWSA